MRCHALVASCGAVLSVKQEQKPEAVDHLGEAVEPRPTVLCGSTHKIKWPNSDHAIYLTISDIEDAQTGQRRPFEVFINSKNMDHFAWTVALTRMISAVFRRPSDSSFVVEELKAVFDPRGGAWMGGKYVPSVLAAIGRAIEAHMIAIGYIPDLEQSEKVGESLSGVGFQICSKCSLTNMKRESGCSQCLDCGSSECG